MITPSFEATGIREALKQLKEVDPTVVKTLRADLRAKITPFAKQVADAVPAEPPLSGMGNTSPTGWSPVRPSVSFTPGRSRKTGDHLVSIRVNPIPARGRRGLYLGELAGSRSSGSTEKGRRLINVLNQRYPMKGKGGRFAYTKFRLLRPDAMKLAKGIVEKSIFEINKKLEL
jgi:hypothetical protein